MKTKRLALVGLVLLMLALFAACPNPITSGKGGVLTVSINNNINARTLVPAIDMTAASFTVSGTGPGTATFSQTTSGAPVTLDGLAFGDWSVTVNALNSAGTTIGSGQATVTVHTGQTSTVNITVVPLTGNGTLGLSVTWTASQVESASVLASLTPPVGPVTPLSFSVTGSQATCSSTTIPSGYQTLTVQLLDNGIPVMGAVEVVRIVAGQATTGSYAFTNVNQPGGRVQVNITPEMAEPITVSISGVAATVSVGGSMTATASVGDGTANPTYVWYLNGLSVGTGPTYVLGSTVGAGWYRLDVTAYAAGGTRAGSATASFQVTRASGAVGHYLYVANPGLDIISAYSIGLGGLLTPLSTPSFATGASAIGIVITPNHLFLYATNASGNAVAGYAIGSGGLLTPLSPPTFPTGAYPEWIAISPNGSFLYAANTSGNTVSGFSIGSNGALTPLSTPTFPTGTTPVGIAVTPDGSFLYVTNLGGTISAYAIGSGGLLTPLSIPSFATGRNPQAIRISPNGSFLYVANAQDNTVSGYAIGSGGLLTPLSTPTFAAGNFPIGIAVTPDSSFLYAMNYNASTVSGYAIGFDGLLTPLSTPAFVAGTGPFAAAVTSDGSFLYVANGSASVSAFAIGSDGLLTPLSTPAFATGGASFGIAIVP